jgi:hypothetical protein
MFHPRFGLRVTLALLLLGGLAAGRGRAGGKAPAGDNKDDLEKVRQELKQLRLTIQEQQKELQALRERLQRLEAGGAGGPFRPPFPGPGGFPVPPGTAKGKILQIDKEDKAKVTFSLTKKDGIQVGQMLIAVRTKGQQRPVGLVRVTEVGDKQSTGKLEPLPNMKGDVAAEVGDEVMAVAFVGPKPGPGPGPGPFPGGFGRAKAKVSKVDKEKKLLTLTVEGDATFKVGQAVVAMRPGAQPRPLGLFKVAEVNAREIVCQLTKALPGGEGAEAQVGDEVQLIPAPPTLDPSKFKPGRTDVPPPG